MSEKYDDVLVPFVAAMRKELHANSGKGDRPGWLAMDANTALLEVYWHAAKLSAAVKNNDGPAIQEHSADVANMAMMVLDICGGLAWVEVAADRAQRSGVSADPLPLTDTYVQPVPDKCDRITWRGQYYHLPVSSQSQPLAEPVGEILSTCGYKEASWRKGKLPPIGTKLYAAPQPLVEPTVDMVLVPREPTQAMLIAAHAVAEDIRGGVFQKAYRAMLAASKGEKA